MTAAADAFMGIFGFKRVDGGMKTDRELLELAAKAVGMGCVCNDAGVMHCPGLQSMGVWNPLIDDGDALRLAVKLGIDVDFYSATVEACREDINHMAESYGECALESTRRAIVRAAAAIGEQMP